MDLIVFNEDVIANLARQTNHVQQNLRNVEAMIRQTKVDEISGGDLIVDLSGMRLVYGRNLGGAGSVEHHLNSICASIQGEYLAAERLTKTIYQVIESLSQCEKEILHFCQENGSKRDHSGGQYGVIDYIVYIRRLFAETVRVGYGRVSRALLPVIHFLNPTFYSLMGDEGYEDLTSVTTEQFQVDSKWDSASFALWRQVTQRKSDVFDGMTETNTLTIGKAKAEWKHKLNLFGYELSADEKASGREVNLTRGTAEDIKPGTEKKENVFFNIELGPEATITGVENDSELIWGIGKGERKTTFGEVHIFDFIGLKAGTDGIEASRKEGVEGSILKEKITGKLGNGDLGIGTEGEVEIGKISAKKETVIGISKEGGMNAYVNAEAIVAAVTGKGTYSISILGFDVAVDLEGYAGGAGAVAKAGVVNNEVVLKAGAASGYGGAATIRIGLNDTGWDRVYDWIGAPIVDNVISPMAELAMDQVREKVEFAGEIIGQIVDGVTQG